MQPAISVEQFEQKIYLFRGKKVMLDSNLATLYGVLTKNLNKAVKRNLSRFPEDFMFQLAAEEAESLRFQFGTSKARGGRRYLPYAFTEHGVAMLSSVLASERAVQMNIVIIRAFIRMREALSAHTELARRLEDLERKYEQHDEELKDVFNAIRHLISTPDPSQRKIGFTASAN